MLISLYAYKHMRVISLAMCLSVCSKWEYWGCFQGKEKGDAVQKEPRAPVQSEHPAMEDISVNHRLGG